MIINHLIQFVCWTIWTIVDSLIRYYFYIGVYIILLLNFNRHFADNNFKCIFLNSYGHNSSWSNWLKPNVRQANIWANNESVQWHIHVYSLPRGWFSINMQLIEFLLDGFRRIQRHPLPRTGRHCGYTIFQGSYPSLTHPFRCYITTQKDRISVTGLTGLTAW